MIFESKFRDQNDMSHCKFLLDQLAFNSKTNSSMTNRPKQFDFTTLKTNVRDFKAQRSK